MQHIATLFIAVFMCGAFALTAQPYVLDTDFSTDGIAFCGAGETNENLACMAILPDRRFLLAGELYAQGLEQGGDAYPALQRLTARGALDGQFGPNGRNFLFGPNRPSMRVTAMAVQSDGKILMAGPRSSSPLDFVVVRMQANGILDPTFGTAGVLRLDIMNASDDLLSAIAVQPDGKVILTGRIRSGGTSAIAILRLQANGAIDSNFGNLGRLILPNTDTRSALNALLLQPDGKIVGGGQQNGDFLLMRLHTNGRLDSTFGTFGQTRLNVSNQDQEYCTALVRLPNGSLLAGGYAGNGLTGGLTVIRFTNNGELDTTFGTNGRGRSNFEGAPGSGIGMVVTSDGNIALAGDFRLPDQPRRLIFTRFVSAGAVDQDFGVSGKVLYELPGSDLTGTSSLFSNADGGLMYGCTRRGRDASDFAVVQLDNNGQPTANFGAKGLVSYDFGLGQDKNPRIFSRPGGKLLVATDAEAGISGYRVGLQILTQTGEPDKDFGQLGKMLIQAPGDLYDLAQQPDGKIIVNTNNYLRDGNSAFSSVSRIQANGRPDSTFTPWISVGTENLSDTMLHREGLLVLPNGNIMAAVSRYDNDQLESIGLSRLKANGRPDSTFGKNGVSLIRLQRNLTGQRRLLAQSDGKIVVICGIEGLQEQGNDFAMLCFKLNGQLDSTFGINGMMTTDFFGGEDVPLAVWQDPANDEMMIVGSVQLNDGKTVIGAARYSSNGSRDLTLGSLGRLTYNLSPQAEMTIQGAYSHPDGRFLVTGRSSNLDETFFFVVRINANGVRDVSFGKDGWIRRNEGAPFLTNGAVTIQSDGRLAWVGSTLSGQNEEAVILRYRPDSEVCRPLIVRTVRGQNLDRTKVNTRSAASAAVCPNQRLTLSCAPMRFCPCQESRVDTLIPEFKDHLFLGITSFDLSLISQHVLGFREITSPYILVAADANRNRQVTTFDIVELRKIILGIYNDSLPNNTSWRFVDKKYVFPIEDPLGVPFPEFVTTNSAALEMVAIKIGDINQDAQPYCDSLTGPAEDRSPNLYTRSKPARAGETITVPLLLNETLDLSAWQYQFQYDPSALELIDIRTPELPERGFSFHPSPDGSVKMLWYSEQPTAASLRAGQPLAEMVFRAKRALPSAVASIEDAADNRWQSQAFDAAGQPHALSLAPAENAATTAAMQATIAPNPANGHQSAQLRLKAPRSGEGTLTVTDMNGREMYRRPLIWSEGENTWLLPSASWPTGTYVWRINGSAAPEAYGRLLIAMRE